MADNDLQIVLPESDEVLTCPQCKTANPLESHFCLNCRTRLQPPAGSKFKWSWIIVLFVCLAGALYYFKYRVAKIEPQITPAEKPPASFPDTRKAEVKSPEKEIVPTKKDEAIAINTSSEKKIPIGIVIIKDINGKIINEIKAPVVGGGWVALPKRACLGGSEWILKIGRDLEVSIDAGIYSDYEKIGLWRALEEFSIEGPELHPWSAEEELTWHALTPPNTAEKVEFENPNAQGYFTEGALAEDISEDGLLTQQDRAVGWTFGNSDAGVFVWRGDEGKYLQPETRVDDFYRITFANSREEEFSKAMAMGAEYSDLEKLEALAGAFRFSPKLTAKETPAHLQTESVVGAMKKLVDNVFKAGFNREVASLFDAPILVEAADVELLLNVTQATALSFGYEEAIDQADQVIEALSVVNEQDSALLSKIFSQLYQDWINGLINRGNISAAWRAYRLAVQRLPEDVYIHLIAVQLALSENNWAEAEELLASRDYPAVLKDKIINLQNQISRLKSQEGKIVINFTPGARQIPLTATLNQSSYQNFIVDTGASMVTIPSSTADELGLAVDNQNPVRKVYTAGGVKYAPEVTLSAITVEGWEVNDIRALVLDIPNQPGWGLLGLNYLQKFRVDINTEAGILLLDPR